MRDADAREYIARYFHAALQEEDLDVFANLFTEDGVLEDPVGTPPLRGRDTIREFLRAGRAMIERSEVTIHAVIPCGDEVAVHWSIDTRTRRGENVAFGGIGIFKFASPGKLCHVREFYDVSQLARLFGGQPGAGP